MLKKLWSKNFIYSIRWPLSLLVVLVAFISISRFLPLPSQAGLISAAEAYYKLYGNWIIFFAAIAEGVVLVNWYAPGTTVIVAGWAFSKENQSNILISIAVVILGFLLAHLVNYALGRLGGHRSLLKFGLHNPLEKAKKIIYNVSPLKLFVFYSHPGLSSLISAGSGVLKLPFKNFAARMIAGVAVWALVWGLVSYNIGMPITKMLGPQAYVLFTLAWIIYLTVKFLKTNSADYGKQPLARMD